jgi:hypothetical protein
MNRCCSSNEPLLLINEPLLLINETLLLINETLLLTSFVVIAVAFLLLGGYVLYWLKKPLVQSVLVKKLLTEVVGKRLLHADVQVGLVYVDVYDRIDIRDLFIEDWDCDTLLYFKRLFVDIDSLSIFNKALSMNEVVLDEPQIHFIKHLNETQFQF